MWFRKQSMAHYGEMLDVYEPDKEVIYQAFTAFFSNPTMTKIKDVGQFSMYMSKTYCLLNRDCRYLVAFVNRDGRAPGTPEEMRNTRWESFQTRTMPENHQLPPHAYKAERGGPLDVPILRTEIGAEASTYSCERLGLTVTLLHTKKGPSEYQDRGTLVAALETYQTIVTFN